MTQQVARVLDVGNCDPDHAMIRRLLTTHFEVELDRASLTEAALTQIKQTQYDLVLFNRIVFDDGSEGIALLRGLEKDADNRPPIMMVSNFREAQDQAVAEGAKRGFGKNALFEPSTIERLADFLPRRHSNAAR